ncbi:MAG TPA: hypothetical protein DCQ37_24535, partial [Desulfobacteraceae bacterium]|nr:hypothetical protein [Desulfobacteraceae bacterium]
MTGCVKLCNLRGLLMCLSVIPGKKPLRCMRIFMNEQEDNMNDEQDYISGMLNRTLLYIDPESVEKVKNTVFAIAGMGGVGAITVELLARWGVKKFRLFDMDVYDASN